MGADAGQRTRRLGNAAVPVDPMEANLSRCATLSGFSLHAGVAIGANDRAGLERVRRYMGRLPLASERLERLSDVRILYRLRHRCREGTSALVFEPREFLARLAAQIPLPRALQVRYHGVLGPCAAWRPYVVPATDDGEGSAGRHACSHDNPRQGRARRRMAWSDLLRRVFAVDALRCDRCGSKMRVTEAVRSSAVRSGCSVPGLYGQGGTLAAGGGARRVGSVSDASPTERRIAGGFRFGGGRDSTAARDGFVRHRARGSREPCFGPARPAARACFGRTRAPAGQVDGKTPVRL